MKEREDDKPGDKKRKTPMNIHSIILDKLYTNSLPRRVVVEFLVDTYKLSVRRSYELVKQSIDEIKDLHKADLESDYTDLVQKYEDLYKKCIDDKNLQTARNILSDIMKLKSLLIVKEEITHKGIEIKYIIPKDE